jgi:hypothetical protein
MATQIQRKSSIFPGRNNNNHFQLSRVEREKMQWKAIPSGTKNIPGKYNFYAISDDLRIAVAEDETLKGAEYLWDSGRFGTKRFWKRSEYRFVCEYENDFFFAVEYHNNVSFVFCVNNHECMKLDEGFFYVEGSGRQQYPEMSVKLLSLVREKGVSISDPAMKIIQRIANFYLEEEKNREIRFKEREENRLKAIQEEKERKEKALAQNTTQFEVFFEEQCEDYFQHLKMIFSQHRQRMEVTASHVEKILQEVTAHARKNRVSENSIPKSLNDFMPYILRQEFFFSDKRFRNYENFIEYLNSQKASA